MYGYICEYCGAHLDPGEHCDCEMERRRIKKMRRRHYDNLFDYAREMEELYDDERVKV